MQTFLPYPDYKKSAAVLDWRRLGKQRVEAYQILRILRGITPNSRWKNHPAVEMWRGYGDSLALYMDTMIAEWVRRGCKNTMQMCCTVDHPDEPDWFGREDFHSAHRSNLLRKDCHYYCQFGWTEENSLPYIWPTRERKTR